MMLKGPKGEKRPADVIGNAVHAMRTATGEAEEGQEPESPAAVLGRKGGGRAGPEGRRGPRSQSHAGAAAGDRQEGRGLAMEQARMNGALSPWWNGVGSGESFTLKVERAGQPPLPWTWEIVGEGGKAGAHRSLRGYRAAEEAWTAGRVALADMERSGRPGALTAE